MKRVLFLTALAASLGGSSASAAMVLCYAGNPACPGAAAWTDQLTLLGHPITAAETFTGSLLSSTGVFQLGGVHGWIEGGNLWRDSVINNATATPPNQPRQTTAFWYQSGGATPVGLWGFGADFNTSPGQGGHASGVTILLDERTIFNLRGFTGGFFGVYVTSGAEKFKTLTLDTQVSCTGGTPQCTGWEIFHIDNLQFALEENRQVQSVPEPGTFGLIGVALTGLGVLRHRRRA